MAQHWTNSATTTLNGGITSGATSLTVNTGDGALFPSTGPFRIRIDNEVIEVGSRSTDTFSSLTRGAEGSAASHSGGAAVKGVLTAGQLAMLHQVGVSELGDSDISSLSPSKLAQASAASGNVLAWNGSQWAPAGGGAVLLGSIDVGSGGSALSFTSIPGTYNTLMLVITGRTTATGPVWGTFQVNTDTGSNYDLSDLFNQNTLGHNELTAQTSFRGIYLNGTANTASYPSSTVLYIPSYANTHFYKTFIATSVGSDAANGITPTLIGGVWRSTSAITRIDSVDTYAQFSSARLYGLVS